jgi:hypothetical protein
VVAARTMVAEVLGAGNTVRSTPLWLVACGITLVPAPLACLCLLSAEAIPRQAWGAFSLGPRGPGPIQPATAGLACAACMLS